MKILFAVFSYLLGSFPTGYVFFYLSEKKDIRELGSRATGATNVLRLKGWKFALPVLFIDFFKGFVPVFLALNLFHDQLLALVCAFLVVLGHCFPVYLKFKGGKGVATTFGAFSVFALKPFLLSLAVFLVVAGVSRYVSLASLSAMLSYPLFLLLFNKEVKIVCLAFSLFLLIAFKHRGNIERLVKRTERKLGEKVR